MTVTSSRDEKNQLIINAQWLKLTYENQIKNSVIDINNLQIIYKWLRTSRKQ